MRDLPLIVNSGPVIALSIVGKLDILRELYSQVVIPQAVFEELIQGSPRAGSDIKSAAPWINIKYPTVLLFWMTHAPDMPPKCCVCARPARPVCSFGRNARD
jgi:hypothetical protein